MNVSRRGFLALASGLLVPEPPRLRSYSFAPLGGWPIESLWPPPGTLMIGRVIHAEIVGGTLRQTLEVTWDGCLQPQRKTITHFPLRPWG